jgi:type II secretory pathway pseudopilin PulG
MMATKRKFCSLPHRRQRAAFTLIEMAVVTALSALLLGVVISLAQGLLRWDRMSVARGLHGEQLAELAELLRTDIRRGTDVLLSANGPLVVVSSTGEQIRYELGNEGCRRTIVPAGMLTPRTDLFAIGGAKSWRVEQSLTGRRLLILVTLERPAAEDPQTNLPPLLVQAELGADLVRIEKSTALPQEHSDPNDLK